MSNNNWTAAERRAYEEWMKTCKRIREGIKPIPKETHSKKQARIKHLLKPENFEEFIDFYFRSPEFEPAPLGWFHWEFINNFFVSKHRKHALELFRESAKSVMVNIFTPIHMLATGDLTGMILASENLDKAKGLIKDVEAQLRHNKRLNADFGPFNILGTWMQGSFQTSSGIGFWAFGLGQNPAGVREGFTRPNYGVVDDADNYKKSKNKTWAPDQKEWVNGEFMGCLAKDNRRFVYCNNRVHKAGLTAHVVGDLREDDPVDDGIAHVKAYLTEDPITHEAIFPEGRTEAEILNSLQELGAEPAWHEYYTLEECAAKIVDYGLTSAKRQLYHKHVVTGDIFDDDNMPWTEPLALTVYDAIVDYTDPAFGESGKGSYKAIVRVGKKDHHYHILKVWLRQLGSWWEVQRTWAEFINNGGQVFKSGNVGFKPVIKAFQSWIECNSLQKSEMRKTFRLANQKHKVAWYPRYDEDHKGDKAERIEGMQQLFNEGYFAFNIQERKNPDMIELREQFKGFPGGYIDGPDAVHGAKLKLDKMVKSISTSTRTGTYKKDKSKVA